MLKSVKHPKCLPTDEWVNKTQSVRTMEYDSATKRNDVLTWAPTWMDPEKHSKPKKPAHDMCITDSTCTKQPALANPKKQKVDYWLPRGGEGNGD